MVKTNKRNQQILCARKKPFQREKEFSSPCKKARVALMKKSRVKHTSKKRVKHSLNSGNKHASFITLKPIPISVPMYMRTWLRVWLTSPKVKSLKYNPFISPVLWHQFPQSLGKYPSQLQIPTPAFGLVVPPAGGTGIIRREPEKTGTV